MTVNFEDECKFRLKCGQKSSDVLDWFIDWDSSSCILLTSMFHADPSQA